MIKLNNEAKLTKYVKAAGCAAKLPPSDLVPTLSTLKNSNPNLLVGFEGRDDAAVYKLTDDIAIVQTLDFITPVCDDPYVYGQIAATNSLSDVFAMGGEVINALNIVGLDTINHKKEILKDILAGGESKVHECGGIVVGGHTIQTPEMYFGLSVTGTLKPGLEWRNNTPKAGDVLLLTKPLGVGVLITAMKADMLSYEDSCKTATQLAQLNQKAAQILREFDVHACTDITGFGLTGHGLEMASDKFTLEIDSNSLPIIEVAKVKANEDLVPGGTYTNRNFVKPYISIKKELPFEVEIFLYDAQTSGGLLVALPKSQAKIAQQKLIDAGYIGTSIIGEVLEKKDFPIIVL
ncbi:MAG: selenide, water dikinase SelD [Campylobacteraceae bacterium]